MESLVSKDWRRTVAFLECSGKTEWSGETEAPEPPVVKKIERYPYFSTSVYQGLVRAWCQEYRLFAVLSRFVAGAILELLKFLEGRCGSTFDTSVSKTVLGLCRHPAGSVELTSE